MKVLICLSVLVISTYAGFVSYPYAPDFRFYGGYYPAFSSHSFSTYKPVYGSFYDFRLGLTPSYYPYGFYPGAGVFASAPTFIHLVPVETESEKKPKSESDMTKDGKNETSTAAPEDKKDNVEKAETKDEEESAKKDAVEIESA